MDSLGIDDDWACRMKRGSQARPGQGAITCSHLSIGPARGHVLGRDGDGGPWCNPKSLCERKQRDTVWIVVAVDSVGAMEKIARFSTLEQDRQLATRSEGERRT